MECMAREKRSSGAASEAFRSIDVLEAVEALARDLEEGLGELTFDEVTTADRIKFIECVRDQHLDRALAARRFDVAAALRRFADDRVAFLADRARRPSLPRSRSWGV